VLWFHLAKTASIRVSAAVAACLRLGVAVAPRSNPGSVSGSRLKIDTPIALDAVEGKLDYLEQELEVLIGFLAPIDEPLGQRERLNNLGYYAGHDDEEDAEEEEQEIVLRSAIEEFQCDNGMNPPSGKFDAATKKKLLAAHGC